MLTSVAFAGRSWTIRGLSNPTQSGMVLTSTTLLATEVYANDEIQAAK